MKANKEKAKLRRLFIWFLINLVVFVSCYLNYRLQLKHRYLFRTLNIGLCLSRAAAMVINFNLLLVWLPMCKYSLTRLACLASCSLRDQRHKLACRYRDRHCSARQEHILVDLPAPSSRKSSGPRALLGRAAVKLSKLVERACWQLWNCYYEAKVESTKSFLIAVDHCKSLHTICASTITIASAIHTVAHLINVINFSKNYDPNLSSLNMAEYKGQNPLQLLVSVPGITGVLMIVILILMSLSSMDLIRNSSYDLFQIFHRLSVVFVLLLVLHPSSHVLKEQSNVDRHHPDLCYNFTRIPALADSKPPGGQSGEIRFDLESQRQSENSTNSDLNTADRSRSPLSAGSGCLDDRPLFVAQNSICCYVLSVGLSCYLLDLLLRKLRRSKSNIQLLNARLDREGNLIELVLSNNHKRFARWLPGQFVYLNCPQIACYEWHPFTISSMNNKTRQFTLHIKTGGDWTQKLRHKLEQLQVCGPLDIDSHSPALRANEYFYAQLALPELLEPGKLKPSRPTPMLHTEQVDPDQLPSAEACMQAGDRGGLYSISEQMQSTSSLSPLDATLSLYIDGPFHSPYERLLEQQVSVCIANGIGWTAFSSVFHSITNNLVSLGHGRDWWSQWCDYIPLKYKQQLRLNRCSSPSWSTKLHMMVIVTSLEQLRPFYQLASDYFKHMQDEWRTNPLDEANPVRQITAFITRAPHQHLTVAEFCRNEGLLSQLDINVDESCHSIRINDVFTIEFGKPDFEHYLKGFIELYADSNKISVYCCGSGQVKQTVQGACRSLNVSGQQRAKFSYREENF